MLVTSVLLVIAGVAVRQADRWHFSMSRPGGALRPEASLREVLSLQRETSNNVTPALLMAGHWIEIAGWWALGASVGSWLWVVVVLVIAGKFRQLQELSHFGVHRSLCRGPRIGDALIEFGAHAPLALQTVSARR